MKMTNRARREIRQKVDSIATLTEADKDLIYLSVVCELPEAYPQMDIVPEREIDECIAKHILAKVKKETGRCILLPVPNHEKY